MTNLEPAVWMTSFSAFWRAETWQIDLALSLTSQLHTFMTFLMTKACLTGNYTYLKISSPAAPGASSSGSWAHCWWRRARASCWQPPRRSSQSKESHKLSQSSKFIVFKHFQATSFFLRKSASDRTKWMPRTYTGPRLAAVKTIINRHSQLPTLVLKPFFLSILEVRGGEEIILIQI